MSEGIKVGDKVWVSKDAPKLLFTRSVCNYPEYVFEVRAIEDDLADIYYGAGKIPIAAFVVPTKYLIKVEDEPKFKVGDKVVYIGENQEFKGRLFEIDGEIFYNDYHRNMQVGSIKCEDYNVCNVPLSDLEPYTEPTISKIKVGDFVRVLENLHEPFCLDVERHLEITNIPPHAVSQKEWKVISVEVRRDCAGRIYTLQHDDSFIYNIPEDCVERVEPKEQTEAEKTDIDNIVDNFAKVLEGSRKAFADIADNYDWQRYETDLAKDIAVKITNKKMDNTPLDVANYAVSVAKAVVENLKKK